MLDDIALDYVRERFPENKIVNVVKDGQSIPVFPETW
jgi:hypothetical protein